MKKRNRLPRNQLGKRKGLTHAEKGGGIPGREKVSLCKAEPRECLKLVRGRCKFLGTSHNHHLRGGVMPTNTKRGKKKKKGGESKHRVSGEEPFHKKLEERKEIHRRGKKKKVNRVGGQSGLGRGGCV